MPQGSFQRNKQKSLFIEEGGIIVERRSVLEGVKRKKAEAVDFVFLRMY